MRYEAVSSTPVMGLEMVALRSCEARDTIYHVCIASTSLTALTSHPATRGRGRPTRYRPTRAPPANPDKNGDVTHSGLRQLFDRFDFLVGDDVNVADDVGTVPLVLLLDGRQHVLGVAVVVVVTAEEAALPAGSLI